MFGQIGNSVVNDFALATRFSLGIVFLFSALPKLRHPLVFARNVVAYEILPAKVANVFAFMLIPLEAFLAIAFFTGWLTDLALPVATAVLMSFLIAVGINLRRGRKISCGCFENASERISNRTLVRLLLLLSGVLLSVVLRNIGGSALPSFGAVTVDASVAVNLLLSALLAVCIILVGMWILSLPELVFLVRHLRWREHNSP
ncbi:MAG: MauE/DoxX family redox-associated membrane protein [Chloroflexia bacterium]